MPCFLNCKSKSVLAKPLAESLPEDRSRFEMAPAVRVSSSRPASGGEITLHFVNYNHEEPQKNLGGIKYEKPIAARPFQADLKLGPSLRVQHVEFLTPEQEQARGVDFEQLGARIRFRVPEFLVYGVVRVQLSKSE